MSAIAILGATGGLGQAIVRNVAKRGPLVIGYRNSADKAESICAELQAAGHQAEAVQVDITNSASVAAFFVSVRERFGKLAGIVSATGPDIPLCPLSEVTDDDFRRIYDTDVFGSFNVLRHGGAALKADGGGPMVLFLTTAVLHTLNNDGMSGGPKSAVSALLRQTAREMGPHNVRCNGVAPGVIDAGMVLTTFEVSDVAKAVIADCLNQTPMGRMGKPEEVAALVEFLLSPGAAYINGQIIGIDGGYSA